jgi:hypothetical protein
MKFAIISNNTVRNIIAADQDFVDAHYPDAINVDEIRCGIGWLYDGEAFAPIPEPVIEEDDSETL